VSRIADMVVARAKIGKSFGTILLPEGLVEFVPEVSKLINELNELLVEGEEPPADITTKLTESSAALFTILPASIKNQLLLDRDPHGNVQVSKIETEGLLILMTEAELEKRRAGGTYEGTFASQAHFFGYEGRAGLPSDFDALYCYGLGNVATSLLKHGLTGYMSNLRNLHKPPSEWMPGGAPITMMMNVERRHGKDKPVIQKALTRLDGAPFLNFCAIREYWHTYDCYSTPGPIQLSGTDMDTNYTLMYEQGVPACAIHQKAPGAELCAESDVMHELRFCNHSKMQTTRAAYRPNMPAILQGEFTCVQRPVVRSATRGNAAAEEYMRETFTSTFNQNSVELVPGTWPTEKKPLRVGVVFCGRQTPAGHNVVAGIYDAITKHNPDSKLFAFYGGTKALFANKSIEVTPALLRHFRNQGGVDMMGRSVDRINTPEHYAQSLATCASLKLDGLSLIGGTISMTHAAYLSEYFAKEGSPCSVVGVPGNVDGDLKNDRVDTTVGFDTATKVYSQLIGNMCIDCNSAKKYYYFIRLMGRSPSHITLECALQTHPNIVLIGEEVEAQNQTLARVVSDIADVIVQRRAADKNYGVVLLPEGFITSIADIKLLLAEITTILANGVAPGDVKSQLTGWSAALFDTLPKDTQQEFVIKRESNGQLNLQSIQTEKLLAHAVGVELAKRKSAGLYAGGFSPLSHYFGYQARSAMPSNFDATLAEVIGRTAATLVAAGATGLMANVRRVAGPVSEWKMEGIPLLELFTVSQDMKGTSCAIEGVDVDLNGQTYKLLQQLRQTWYVHETYRNPGPVQFSGSYANDVTFTLKAEREGYAARLKEVEEHCTRILELCRSGCGSKSLATACTGLGSLVNILEMLEE